MTKVGGVVSDLVGATIGVMTFCVVKSILKEFPDFEYIPTAWVVSPSGRSVVELPYWTAMRVHRKRGWDFSSVRPYVPWWDLRWHGVKIRPMPQAWKLVTGLMPTLLGTATLVGLVKSMKCQS